MRPRMPDLMASLRCSSAFVGAGLGRAARGLREGEDPGGVAEDVADTGRVAEVDPDGSAEVVCDVVGVTDPEAEGGGEETEQNKRRWKPAG